MNKMNRETRIVKIITDDGAIRYNLITNRKTVYELHPSPHGSHLFYIIRPNRKKPVCTYKGIKRFTDINGFLEPKT